MQPTLQGIMNIGVSSLRAQQAALATTSHNISNTNTEGYTRQRVSLVEDTQVTIPEGEFGLGVRLLGATRFRSTLLDTNYRTVLAQQNQYDTFSQYAQALEGVLGDINSQNLGTTMTDFFNAWHDLSLAPGDLSARQAVLDKATIITDALHVAANGATTVNSDVDLAVTTAANDMNNILQQLSTVNRAIARAELGGGLAPDLRDQRDLLLDKLSAYTDVVVSDGDNHMVNVTANGEALLTGTTVASVQAVAGAGGHLEVRSANNVSLTTADGKLAGFQQSYAAADDTTAGLNALALALRDAVNAVHAAPGAAYDLHGAQGGDFFTGTDAASLQVSATLLADPTKIAASGSTAAGGNSVALALAQLQDADAYPSGAGTMTLNSAFNALLGKAGTTTQRAQQFEQTYQQALDSVQGERQSIGGVNMDEELSNMMAYQHAYEAAARIVSTIDQMMDTIIRMKT